MTRFERFTFLCDENERRVIAVLAAHLQRSQSDAVRYVVLEAAHELERLGYLRVGGETALISNEAAPAVSK
jgi:hypothetical protein